jgi:hypothetical protein
MSNLLESITAFLQDGLAGDPPPPANLLTIGDRLSELLAVSVDPSGEGIARWLDKLHEIAGDAALRETLVVRAVQMRFPRLAEALTLANVIRIEWAGDGPSAFRIDWAQLDRLLTQPGASGLALLLNKVQNLEDLHALQVLGLMLIAAPRDLLALEYRQQGFAGLPLGGVPGVNSEEIRQIIDELIQSPLRLPLPFDLPLSLAEFMQTASATADGPLGSITLDAPANLNQLDDLSLTVRLKQAESVQSKTLDLGNGWRIGFDGSDSGDKSYRLQFSPTGLDPAVRSEGDLATLISKQPADVNALLIGDPAGTHFAVQAVQLGLRLRAKGPLFDVMLKLARIEFALAPDFLKFLSFGLTLPTLLRYDTDVEMSYAQGKGLTGQGSADGMPALGVQFATPLNLKIGGAGAGLNVEQAVTRLEVTTKAGGLHFRARFRYGASAQFGPLRASMEGAGIWIGRWQGQTGAPEWPDGIGLTLDAGPVAGGGFLKFTNENEIAGALQLKILGIGAFAYGLYQTLPGGDAAFVALIGIRLPLPGVQLGFGFAISGFGGLVGINRRADTDLLRERLASGASGDVLFNDDPLRNAPKLLGDMRQFFPPEKGVFLIGPTLQINWLLILKLDVGLFIELPGPRKIFIAGSARLVLGSEAFALVYLRMDFIGGIDLVKSLIFFDAMLVNSHVLGIFRITGGVALRIAFGSNGYFLFTVGGFHPSFNPGPMELPRVARVGVSVSLGVVWLKQEMYLAITSNTFQLGARTEAGLEIGPISAHGWFGFDALIQFKPFYFVARVDAGFDVEVFGVSLCSVRVEGQLSGPGPLTLQAKASVRLLFIKVSAQVTIELSSNPPEPVVAIADLPAHLKPELRNPANLRVEGEDRSVIFAGQVAAPTDKSKLLAPVGALIWEQKRVPLAFSIQKAEGVQLGGWHRLKAVSSLGADTPEYDWFGVGTYLNLSDAEALNTSRFDLQQSGLRMDTGILNRGNFRTAKIEIEIIKLPARFKFLGLFAIRQYVSVALAGILNERAGGARPEGGDPAVTVAPESWTHLGPEGARRNAAPLNAAQAFVEAKRFGGVALPAVDAALDLTGVF